MRAAVLSLALAAGCAISDVDIDQTSRQDSDEPLCWADGPAQLVEETEPRQPAPTTPQPRRRATVPVQQTRAQSARTLRWFTSRVDKELDRASRERQRLPR